MPLTYKLFSVFVCLIASGVLCLPASTAGFRPSDVYKQYLHRLYYATDYKQIAPYFQERVRERELTLGEDDQKRRLIWWKRGYVAKFRVLKEEIVPSEGSDYTSYAFIKGEGIGVDAGQRVNAEVHVVMIMERGGWKIQRTGWTGLANVRKK